LQKKQLKPLSDTVMLVKFIRCLCVYHYHSSEYNVWDAFLSTKMSACGLAWPWSDVCVRSILDITFIIKFIHSLRM